MNKKLTIEIDNLTEAQAIAIEDMFLFWENCGHMGSSRWSAFYADGDGNFHPKIKINNEDVKLNKIAEEARVKDNFTLDIKRGDYAIDFDNIAWKLHSYT
jgi:hypothetical protein